MSASPIAILDTDVLLFLIGDAKSKDRTDIVRDRVKAMRGLGITMWVPAPAIAELGASGLPLKQIATAVSSRLDGLRVVDFGMAAAEVCGRMVADRLAAAKAAGTRPPGGRVAMKFDAMIAAIAHAMQARYLVSANVRDMRPYLNAVNSSTVVHEADKPSFEFPYQHELLSAEEPAADVLALSSSQKT